MTKQLALSGTSLLAAMVLAAGPALAQAPASQAAEGPEEVTDLDELVVTGTSIRGVPPTGSNLISVTREDIETLGGANTPAGTYAGMVRANVETIVNALKGGNP